MLNRARPEGVISTHWPLTLTDDGASIMAYMPYEGPVVTHDEAVAKGLKRFFPRSTCSKGHISERFTSSYNCIACHYVTTAAYAKAHPEKAAARQTRYREVHPEPASGLPVANKDKAAVRSKAYKQGQS